MSVVWHTDYIWNSGISGRAGFTVKWELNRYHVPNGDKAKLTFWNLVKD